MAYIDLQHLSAAEFKRLCGVSRDTFNEMVEVLRPHLERQGQRGGQNKLSTQDQLLVTLDYTEQEMTRGRGDTQTRSVKCSEAASGCGASRGHTPPLKAFLSVAPLQVEPESPSVMSPRHRVTASSSTVPFLIPLSNPIYDLKDSATVVRHCWAT